MLATTLVQMNLQQLTGNAERVFRGRVTAIDSGLVAAGGAQLPTVTYKILVEESFKGEFADNNKQTVAVVTMISNKTAKSLSGNYQRFSPLMHMPKLEIGQTYLLFTTQPSRIGLSTTVGLGQGAFRIAGKPGAETAVNELTTRACSVGWDVLPAPRLGQPPATHWRRPHRNPGQLPTPR